MLTVRDLGGFVRIVDKGKQDGHTSVRDVVLFSKIGKNRVLNTYTFPFDLRRL